MEKNNFLQIYLSIMENGKKTILVIFFLLQEIEKKNNNNEKEKNLVQKIWSRLLPICIARKILYCNLVRSGFSCIATEAGQCCIAIQPL